MSCGSKVVWLKFYFVKFDAGLLREKSIVSVKILKDFEQQTEWAHGIVRVTSSRNFVICANFHFFADSRSVVAEFYLHPFF